MKPGLFSFIGDEFEGIFQFTDLFLPGIEKIVGVYYSRKGQKLRALVRQREESESEEYADLLQTRENLVLIQKYRSENHQYTWIKRGDLPFEAEVTEPPEVSNLFTEMDNIILVLKFKNDHDHLYDLLLIYFNKNFGNFAPTKSDKLLSADNKSIIGHFLYYQFKSFIQINRSNRKLLQILNNGVRSVIHENKSLKEQLSRIEASYGENVLNLARQQLAGLSQEYGREYNLTDDAEAKIRSFKGNIKHLPLILKNAVIFTENLLLMNDEDSPYIEPFSLDFNSYQVEDQPEYITKKIDSRQSRAIQLLDKLERAASLLKSRNTALISAKVGQAMDPPVTAPAITDALGKHRVMIRQLLEKYPDKWEIIRKEFRPLLNQLNKDKEESLKEASA